MDSKKVSLPLFHEHLMMPWNDLRKGDCCRRLDANSDGYYCKICDFFIHKKCGDETFEYMEHPSHSDSGHTLKFFANHFGLNCSLCGRFMKEFTYRCECCKGFEIDIFCARDPPPEVIDISETHPNRLTLLKERIKFDCEAKCGKISIEFPYKCHECNIFFHVDCVWLNHALEVNHSNHSLHPLKLHMGSTPNYTDGNCSLCGRKIEDKLYYHCSSCKFTLDMRCVLNPPPQSLVDLKTHDHKLTFFPRRISFTCNVCAVNEDGSPYVCVECGFMIHGDCVNLPRVININRHDHRLARTSLLGIVNSVCGVCHQKMDWSCGGYSCQKCQDYVVHSKCATRQDVWNGKELEEVSEEIDDVNPYVVIDDHTIQYFSHIEHNLRFHILSKEENKWCNACSYPILLQSFYSCIDCDYILHQTCAEFPKKKRHVAHNEQLTLVTSDAREVCNACHRMSSGFKYNHGNTTICLLCASVSEPFFHQSHPHHPLYYSPQDQVRQCNGWKELDWRVLTCIEKDCGFCLDFECATLPLVIKHRVDDHPLSLCFGEKVSGRYWCDICEKETNPKTWFYTCKDHRACLHPKCVFGDLFGLMTTSTINMYERSWEVVLNNHMSRPFCSQCKLHCLYPIMLKRLEISHMYVCSGSCMDLIYVKANR